ncbi:unnamed protein product [Arctogadus glacialis]
MIVCGAALESSSLLLSLLPPLVQTEKKRQHFSWCRLDRASCLSEVPDITHQPQGCTLLTRPSAPSRLLFLDCPELAGDS